jgi:alanine racemase
MKNTYISYIEIDLCQFRKNISIIKEHIGPSLYCLPIKANAYGHGLVKIGKEAEKAGVDYLAVAHLAEGIKLRESNISLPILVLGSFLNEQIKDLIDYELEIAVSSKYKAMLLLDYCIKNNKKCCVHLKIDTGLNRTGVRPETGIELYNFLKDQKKIEIKGIFSHLACGDNKDNDFNSYQFEKFDIFLNSINMNKDIICHIANSGAVCFYPGKMKHMVRCGALSFGSFRGNTLEKLKGVQPFFSVKSRVAFFKVIEKGWSVGYNRSYVAKSQTRIVTVPIGYGDGYSRALSNKGSVLIRGKKYPIAGIIAMDQLTADISLNEAYIGDEVVLIGKQQDQQISIFEVADLCGTIAYEILCLFNERLPRIYIN